MPLPRLDLETVRSVETLCGQLVWTHLNSVEGQLLLQVECKRWLRLTFAQVMMSYYNSHLTCVLVLESQGLWWHKVRGQSMHQGTCCSSKDEQASPQSPSDSSIQLWLFDMFYFFPSPLIAWKALGTLSSFSSLMQQSWILGHCKAPCFCPMHDVVQCHTPNVPVAQKLGLQDRSKYLNGGGKKKPQRNSTPRVPLSTYHHLIAEIGSLCSCFTPGKAVLPSSPACLMAHWEGHAPPDSVTSGISWEVV